MVMHGILGGLRIIEGSAYVAAPLGGLTLAQLGADVIRFDPPSGGLDFHRWPVTEDGKSLFWNGLNRAKRSVAIDIRNEQGQELIAQLITTPGDSGGIYLTNLPPRGLLSYESLVARRPDLIMVVLTGNYDGSSEVDYTVHPSMGYPLITGERESTRPINSVLPTWDLILGNMAALAILAAERKRRLTGKGEYIKIALSDVALSVVASLGRMAQAHLGSEEVKPDGNFLYGAFGRNFTTRDGREIMIVALTGRQWSSLKKAVGDEEFLIALEHGSGLTLEDEGNRYLLRDQLATWVEKWVKVHDYAEISATLDREKVSWSTYRTFHQLLREDPRASKANPSFTTIFQPGIGELPTISSPLRFHDSTNIVASPAPSLGEHTTEVLQSILGLSESQIRKLQEEQIIP